MSTFKSAQQLKLASSSCYCSSRPSLLEALEPTPPASWEPHASASHQVMGISGEQTAQGACGHRLAVSRWPVPMMRYGKVNQSHSSHEVKESCQLHPRPFSRL